MKNMPKRKAAIRARNKIRKLFKTKRKTKNKQLSEQEKKIRQKNADAIIQQMKEVDKYGAFKVPLKSRRTAVGVPQPHAGFGNDDEKQDKQSDISNDKVYNWVTNVLPTIRHGNDVSHQILPEKNVSPHCIFENSIDFSKFISKQKISQRSAKTADKQ
eukprot:553762_1